MGRNLRCQSARRRAILRPQRAACSQRERSEATHLPRRVRNERAKNTTAKVYSQLSSDNSATGQSAWTNDNGRRTLKIHKNGTKRERGVSSNGELSADSVRLTLHGQNAITTRAA